MEAKFSIFIDGYADVNAFLVANFTPKNRLNTANASYKVDGINIGESLAQGFEANAPSVLYLGKNPLIKVSKKVDEKMSKSSFFGNTKTTTNSWDYEITNGSNRTWEITLAERIPLSTSDDIKISEKSNDKASTDKEGRAEYKFSLKASEKKSINFGYEVSEPK